MIAKPTRKHPSPGHVLAGDGQEPTGHPCGQADGRAGRRGRRVMYGLLALATAVTAGAVAYALSLPANPLAGQGPRLSGIPAGISTRLADLMGLDPLPGQAAPGFTLTDQSGRTMALSGFRGKVVVLQFMDPHCTDICPIVAQEFADAYRDLGPEAGKVVFAAVNVNPYYRSVHAVAAFSAEQRLTAIPGWHYFTGSLAALRAAWDEYHIAVSAPNPGGDILHTSAIYVIDRQGKERYLAMPEDEGATKPRSAYGTSNETGYVSGGDMTDWGRGIAELARSLAG